MYNIIFPIVSTCTAAQQQIFKWNIVKSKASRAGSKNQHQKITILFAFLLSTWACGGSPTPEVQVTLTESWRNERPSWTPDGKIVFSSNRAGNWDLVIMDSDGSNQKFITTTESNELFPSVSPDGKEIAYVMPIEGNYDIYVLNLITSESRRITQHEKIDDWPAWFDEGNKITFDSDKSGSWAIYMMDPDGGNKTLLVDDPAVKDTDPHSTPGSPWLVFRSEREDGNQIFAYNPENNEEIQLTRNDLKNAHPALSPNGETVIYNAGTDFWHLYLISVEGGEENQLTSSEYDDKWGAWSPDGSKIAFQSNRDGKWEIYLLHLESMVQTRLTHGVDGKF